MFLLHCLKTSTSDFLVFCVIVYSIAIIRAVTSSIASTSLKHFNPGLHQHASVHGVPLDLSTRTIMFTIPYDTLCLHPTLTMIPFKLKTITFILRASVLPASCKQPPQQSRSRHKQIMAHASSCHNPNPYQPHLSYLLYCRNPISGGALVVSNCRSPNELHFQLLRVKQYRKDQLDMSAMMDDAEWVQGTSDKVDKSCDCDCGKGGRSEG